MKAEKARALRSSGTKLGGTQECKLKHGRYPASRNSRDDEVRSNGRYNLGFVIPTGETKLHNLVKDVLNGRNALTTISTSLGSKDGHAMKKTLQYFTTNRLNKTRGVGCSMDDAEYPGFKYLQDYLEVWAVLPFDS